MKILFTKKLIFVGFFLLLAGSVFGQATIQGIVADSLTQEPLFGASIVIVGSSQGAASDFNGEYKIPNVSDGKIKIKVSYVGYATKFIDATIKGQKIIDIYFQLSAKSIEGQTVVVTAQAQGQLGAINQQLSANTIKNVVSADKIRQLPDDNAATALSRLPGVSLMNGDQVVIRGVEAKLNQVLVNGIQMPSTNMGDRAAGLGFISSNMLSGIEVIKAITPDLDANTIGGVVNLRLASAQPGLHADFMGQGNYNSTDRTANTYKIYGQISNRFFDDQLGVILNLNTERSDGGNQSASIGYTYSPDLSPSLTYGDGVYLANGANFGFNRNITTTSGGSLILDFKLPHGKIVMQNMYAGTLMDNRGYGENINFGGTQVNYVINRNKYGKDFLVNALQVENSFGDVKLEASLSHSYTDQYTRINYDNNGGEWATFRNSTTYQHPFDLNPPGGPTTRYVTQAEQMNMPWSRVYGIFDNINPADADSAKLTGWPGAGKSTFQQHLYNASLDVSIPVTFADNVNATFKVGGKFVRTTRTNDFDRYFSGQDPYVGVHNYFGGGINYLSNTQALRFAAVKDQDFTRGQYFLQNEYNFKNGFKNALNTDIYDAFLTEAISHWEVPFRKDQTFKDDWNGAEMFNAAYLMGTFNLFDNITVVGGVRFESYNMQYHAQYTFISHSVDGDCISTLVGTIVDLPDDSPYLQLTRPKDGTILDTVYNYHTVPNSANNVNRTDNNMFPSLQIKYKVSDNADIRVAYTTGISRPDYGSILPKVAIYPFQNFEMGNPLLRPTTARNIDVIGSLYSNTIGLLTINGFYKELKDSPYGTSVMYKDMPLFAGDVSIPDSAFLWNHFSYTMNKYDPVGVTLNNPNTGYIRGIEIDWQTNFWYLPEPFNSVVFNINYTKSASQIGYRQLTSVPYKYRDERGRLQTGYNTRDTTIFGRMTNQANDVLNAALGIDYKGFSGRLSFNLRGNVLTTAGSSRPEEIGTTGNVLRWDFTLKQNLPIEGMSLSLNGINIFHNAVRSYRSFRLTPTSPVTENMTFISYEPTMFQMNLRYNF